MSQPTWEFVGNFGDANPIDHGGCFVFRDTTGVYPPECEILESPPESDEFWDDETGDYSADAQWTVYRFPMENCFYGRADSSGNWQPCEPWENGILSDNQFHRLHAAWFADYGIDSRGRMRDELLQLADFVSMPKRDLVEMFLSSDPAKRVYAWRAVGDYWGYGELDHYPLQLSHAEVRERYASHPYVKGKLA